MLAHILQIIIPRHIERIDKITADLKKLRLKIVLSSELNTLNDTTDILLINSYGEALKFYNISKYVFIGKSLLKSLIKNGGQNPIEAARLGCKIFHGPFISNFEETYEYLKKLNVTKEINNSDELGLLLVEEFQNDKAKNQEVTKKIEDYGENILNNVITEIKAYI